MENRPYDAKRNIDKQSRRRKRCYQSEKWREIYLVIYEWIPDHHSPEERKCKTNNFASSHYYPIEKHIPPLTLRKPGIGWAAATIFDRTRSKIARVLVPNTSMLIFSSLTSPVLVLVETEKSFNWEQETPVSSMPDDIAQTEGKHTVLGLWGSRQLCLILRERLALLKGRSGRKTPTFFLWFSTCVVRVKWSTLAAASISTLSTALYQVSSPKAERGNPRPEFSYRFLFQLPKQPMILRSIIGRICPNFHANFSFSGLKRKSIN